MTLYYKNWKIMALFLKISMFEVTGVRFQVAQEIKDLLNL